MRIIVLAFLTVVGFLLQSTVFNSLRIVGVIPDLILILVVFFALLNGARSGVFLGFLAGLVEDLLLGRFFGMNAMAKMVTGYLIGWLNQKVFKENFIIPFIVVFIGTIFNYFIFFLLALITGFPLDVSGDFRFLVLPVAIYNSCLVPLFYPLFYRSSTQGILRSGRRDLPQSEHRRFNF